MCGNAVVVFWGMQESTHSASRPWVLWTWRKTCSLGGGDLSVVFWGMQELHTQCFQTLGVVDLEKDLQVRWWWLVGGFVAMPSWCSGACRSSAHSASRPWVLWTWWKTCRLGGDWCRVDEFVKQCAETDKPTAAKTGQTHGVNSNEMFGGQR